MPLTTRGPALYAFIVIVAVALVAAFVILTPETENNEIAELRRGQVQGQELRGNATVITAHVPLANMFGYINNLRSMSSGRASFTMQFSHYEAVPQNISEEIQAKYA